MLVVSRENGKEKPSFPSDCLLLSSLLLLLPCLPVNVTVYCGHSEWVTPMNFSLEEGEEEEGKRETGRRKAGPRRDSEQSNHQPADEEREKVFFDELLTRSGVASNLRECCRSENRSEKSPFFRIKGKCTYVHLDMQYIASTILISVFG